MSDKPTYEELENRIQELELVEAKLHKAVAALQESEGKYRRVSENSPAVLYQFLLRPDGTISFPYVSDLVQTLFGVSAQAVMHDPQNLLGLIHPDDQEMFQQEVQRSAQTMTSFPLILRCLKDGEIIWIEARGIPAAMDNEEILWDGFLLDITERKQVENQRDQLIDKLQKALAEIKRLEGFLPICSNCKKIRDDNGNWEHVETYIRARSDAEFTHSVCPSCFAQLYPGLTYPKEESM